MFHSMKCHGEGLLMSTYNMFSLRPNKNSGAEPLWPSWISINTILACFDPEVILLLQSKFRLKSTKGLGNRVRTGLKST